MLIVTVCIVYGIVTLTASAIIDIARIDRVIGSTMKLLIIVAGFFPFLVIQTWALDHTFGLNWPMLIYVPLVAYATTGLYLSLRDIRRLCVAT